MTITNDKGIVGEEGDFLTDDRPHKANVESFKGTLIHFGEDGIFPHWKSIAEHFKLNVELE